MTDVAPTLSDISTAIAESSANAINGENATVNASSDVGRRVIMRKAGGGEAGRFSGQLRDEQPRSA